MFFHVSLPAWNAGDVINPGNWGRQLSALGTTGIVIGTDFRPLEFAKTAMWEASLETARLAIDPALPSRLNCVFLTDDLNHARDFRNRYRGGQTIYTCNPVAAGVIQHAADFIHLDTGHQAWVSEMPRKCMDYWRLPPAGMKEIIYAGPVIVTGVTA